MWTSIVILGVFVVVCSGQNSPVPPPPPVRCGDLPRTIYSCLGNPKVVKPEVISKCKAISECEKMKCIFEKSGWLLKDGKVDIEKVKAHYEQFAKDNPAWSKAVTHVKDTCLAKDLPVQGIYLDCPAYDIVHCTISAFIRNAQPSQWKQSLECEYPRQFAAVCPICPGDCFAPAIPIGSCNACRLLPTPISDIKTKAP